jgi:hypothetical protein
MKSCPTCNRTYPDDTLAFCLVDGSILSAPYELENPGRASSPQRNSLQPTEVLNPTIASPQPTITALHPPEPLAQRQTSTPPQRRGKRLQLFVIVAAVVVIGVALGVYLLWPSGSLGTYKGSLVELFPKSMGNYQLDDSRNENTIKDRLKAEDGWLVFYQQRARASTAFPDFVQPVAAQAAQGAPLLIAAFNFSSIENAKAGLQGLRKALADATVIDQGAKKKGLYTVGERLVLIPHQNVVRIDQAVRPDKVQFIQIQSSSVLSPQTKVVAWTNGSILFLVQDSQNQALEIEGLFPY